MDAAAIGRGFTHAAGWERLASGSGIHPGDVGFPFSTAVVARGRSPTRFNSSRCLAVDRGDGRRPGRPA